MNSASMRHGRSESVATSSPTPIVFVVDDDVSVRLTKPFDDDVLLSAMRQALERSQTSDHGHRRQGFLRLNLHG
jgi:DNA-binding response OmpR family regulator